MTHSTPTLTRYALRATAGPNAGEVFLLARMRMTVGRSPDADISIRELVSPRRRFAIDWSEASRTHTLEVWDHLVPVYHNGESCNDPSPRRLAVGDCIELGKSVLVYEQLAKAERGESSK